MQWRFVALTLGGTVAPARMPVKATSAIGATDDVHEFRNLLALVGLTSRCDRLRDAMRNVIAQNLFLDTAQRGAHGRYLRDDVDAIAIIVDHAGQAAHLALDAIEPLPA